MAKVKHLVRTGNWEKLVKLEKSLIGTSFEFVEAATRAVEEMYAEEITSTNDGEAPKISAAFEISRMGHQPRKFMGADSISDFVKYIYAPLVLANAGKYAVAEHMMALLKESEENEE